MKSETNHPNPGLLNTPLQPGANTLPTVCLEPSPASASLEALLTTPNPNDTALVPHTVAPNHIHPSPQASHPVALAPSVQSPITPFDRPARRNGKIARLPKPVRDVVNRMLALNTPQDRIVSALDELGIRVNQQNISNWKTRGGYREWCLAQEHATQLRLHQDNLLDLMRRHDAPELPEIGLQAAATQLSSFFLTADARQLLAADPKEYERRVSMLNRISAQLKALQDSRDAVAKARGRDHDPDRIRNETNNSLERLTDSYTSKTGESPKDPDIPHRNRLPNPAELFNFTERALDDHKDDSLKFMQVLSRCLSKPQSPKRLPTMKASLPNLNLNPNLFSGSVLIRVHPWLKTRTFSLVRFLSTCNVLPA